MSKQLFYRSEGMDDVWIHVGGEDEWRDCLKNIIDADVAAEVFGELPVGEVYTIELRVLEMTDAEVAAIPDM